MFLAEDSSPHLKEGVFSPLEDKNKKKNRNNFKDIKYIYLRWIRKQNKQYKNQRIQYRHTPPKDLNTCHNYLPY